MNILRPDYIPPWVPTEMLAKLDPTEFETASSAALRERELLSSVLDANVAAYPVTAKGRPHGLCSFYRAAHLTTAQVQRLRLSERNFPDVLFVAYRQPLQRHDEADAR